MTPQLTEYAKHLNASPDIISALERWHEKHTAEIDEWEHIVDYLVGTGIRTAGMSFPQAVEQSKKWTQQQIKKGNNIKELPADTETVLDFGDGMKIVRLVGENAYKREGALMSHCVASYFGRDTKVFSLRDKNNNPHATFEIE